MNRKKVKEMIHFSFYKNIQNPWFLLFNIISLICTVVMLNWGSISSLFTNGEEAEIFEFAILDRTQMVYEDLLSQLQDNKDLKLSYLSENTYTEENIPDHFAVVEILPDEFEIFQLTIISKEGINTKFYTPMIEALKEVRNHLLQTKYSVSAENLALFQSDLTIERVMLAVNAEDSSTKELVKLFSSALTYLLTLFIFSKMANEIAQEKQAKSSEYILTTVSAKEYLFAKIFSNIAILLIQGVFLFVYYFIAVAIMNIIHISTTDLSFSINALKLGISMDVVMYIIAVIAYSVLNLILLCIIQATLSAKTSSTTEAGNTVSLLTVLMMAAYIATVYFITPYNKVNLFLSILSCLPILSAYFIPALMVVGQASVLQIVFSFLLLLIMIPVSFHFCAGIFKNGILDYTKKKKEKTVKEKQISFLTKREMKQVGFVLGLGILLYIGLQSILSLVFQFTLPPLLESCFTETEITLIMQIVLSVVSLGLASAFVLSYVEKTESAEKVVSSKNKGKIICITLFFVFAIQALLSLIVYPAIGLDYNMTDMFEVTQDSSLLSKVILILSLAVTPAIFEELFFRKAIIDFTLPYGKKFALLSSALLFGLLHMNLSQGLFAFLIGLVFGGIYLYTKDIKLTILIHFINNGIAAISMIISETNELLLNGILLFILIIGFVFFLITLIKKDSRQKIIQICKTPIQMQSIQNRYQFIFTDFTFDVAMLLVVLMSFLTENLLR